jgi:hypothetical protein
LLVIVDDDVALNVAVVAPAVTVTDDGTVIGVMLLVSATLAPPAGAVAFKVTIQLAAAPGTRLPGLHASDEIVGTVTIAPVPEKTDTILPVVSTPTGLARAIPVVPAVGASVSCTNAATPVAIVFVFDPVRTQVNKPVAGAQ